MTKSKRFFRFLFAVLAVFAISASFLACSSDDGGENGGGQVTTVTVTFYADTTSVTPRTATIESGKTLSASLAIAPEGYSFKKWMSADGTDYTNKPITSDVTLFAYFEKSSSATEGTKTTTTTNEKSVETDKTTTETKDSSDGSTVTKVEETTKKIGTTETIESTSTTTETSDGTKTSETTIITKDSEGNATSIVETSVAADGTTTTKTTDAEGNTSTKVTDKDGNEKPLIDINAILLEKLGAASTATEFKPSVVAPATGMETYIINEDVNAVMWLDGTTIFYYAEGYTDSGKGIPLGLSSAGMFKGCTSLVTIDMTGFDTSDCVDMSSMFNRCTALVSVDVSKFDTSKVTKMSNMFNHCEILETVDVSNFNTSNVATMRCMFNYCAMVTSLDVGDFDTSKVTDMHAMFHHCEKLVSLDISKFKTGNVTDISNMFNHCDLLTAIDVSKFDTSKMTNMAKAFGNCRTLTTLAVSKFDTSNVTTMAELFIGCTSLEELDVSHFDTGNVTDMGRMFYNCRKLTSLAFTNFDTKNVTNMEGMFKGCSSLIELDLNNFDMNKVEKLTYSWISSSDASVHYEGLFGSCSKLKTIYVASNTDWNNLTRLTESTDVFYGCTSLTGGNGTTYDSAHTDKTYARVDGGASAPGYFTVKSDSSATENGNGISGTYKGTISMDGETLYVIFKMNANGTWSSQGYTDNTYTTEDNHGTIVSGTYEQSTNGIALTGTTLGNVTASGLIGSTTDNWQTMIISGVCTGELTKQ